MDTKSRIALRIVIFIFLGFSWVVRGSTSLPWTLSDEGQGWVRNKKRALQSDTSVTRMNVATQFALAEGPDEGSFSQFHEGMVDHSSLDRHGQETPESFQVNIESTEDGKKMTSVQTPVFLVDFGRNIAAKNPLSLFKVIGTKRVDVVYSKDLGLLYVLAVVANTSSPSRVGISIIQGATTDLKGLRNGAVEKFINYVPGPSSDSQISTIAGWGMVGSLALSFGATLITPGATLGVGAMNFVGFVQTFYMTGSLPITSMPSNYKQAASGLDWIGLNPNFGPFTPTSGSPSVQKSFQELSNTSVSFPYPPVIVAGNDSNAEEPNPVPDPSQQEITIIPMPQEDLLDPNGDPVNPFNETVIVNGTENSATEAPNPPQIENKDNQDTDIAAGSKAVIPQGEARATPPSASVGSDIPETKNPVRIQESPAPVMASPDSLMATTPEVSSAQVPQLQPISDTALSPEKSEMGLIPASSDTGLPKPLIGAPSPESMSSSSQQNSSAPAPAPLLEPASFEGQPPEQSPVPAEVPAPVSAPINDSIPGKIPEQAPTPDPAKGQHNASSSAADTGKNEESNPLADTTTPKESKAPSWPPPPTNDSDIAYVEPLIGTAPSAFPVPALVPAPAPAQSTDAINSTGHGDKRPKPLPPPQHYDHHQYDDYVYEDKYYAYEDPNYLNFKQKEEEREREKQAKAEENSMDGPIKNNTEMSTVDKHNIDSKVENQVENDEKHQKKETPSKEQSNENVSAHTDNDPVQHEDNAGAPEDGKSPKSESRRSLMLVDPLSALSSSGFSYVVTTATPEAISHTGDVSSAEISEQAIGTSALSRIRAIQSVSNGTSTDNDKLEVLWNVLFWGSVLIAAIFAIHALIMGSMKLFKVRTIPKMLHIPRLELLVFMMILPMISAAGAAALQSTSPGAVTAGVFFGVLIPFGFILGASLFLVFAIVRPKISKRRAVFVVLDTDSMTACMPSDRHMATLGTACGSNVELDVESRQNSFNMLTTSMLGDNPRDSIAVESICGDSSSSQEDNGSNEGNESLLQRIKSGIWRWILSPLFGFSSPFRPPKTDSGDPSWLGQAKHDAVFVKRFGCFFEDAHGPQVYRVSSRYEAIRTPISERDTVGGGILVSMENEGVMQSLQTYGILFAAMKMILFAVIINGPGGINNIAQVIALMLVCLLHILYLRICVPYRLRVELAAEIVAATCDFAVFVCGIVLVAKKDWTDSERNSMGVAMLVLQAVGFLVFITVRVILALRTATLAVLPAVRAWCGRGT